MLMLTAVPSCAAAMPGMARPTGARQSSSASACSTSAARVARKRRKSVAGVAAMRRNCTLARASQAASSIRSGVTAIP
jgi:hypothetical protein